jgi:LemA protein
VKQQVTDAKTPEDLQAAEAGMTSVLSRLMLVVEAYPDLKATQNFQDLQVQLEGTENRIQMERNNYNEAVQGYKLKVRSFPTNMLAGMFGFESGKWSMFQANETAQNAPNVDFSG